MDDVNIFSKFVDIRRKEMCFSNVYMRERNEENLILEEASRVLFKDGIVTVSTIFGDEKSFKGFSIYEVNLLENYVILRGREVSDA
jgi:predicted RNA-binding protein